MLRPMLFLPVTGLPLIRSGIHGIDRDLGIGQGVGHIRHLVLIAANTGKAKIDVGINGDRE